MFSMQNLTMIMLMCHLWRSLNLITKLLPFMLKDNVALKFSPIPTLEGTQWSSIGTDMPLNLVFQVLKISKGFIRRPHQLKFVVKLVLTQY